jgi:hypothetical protein
LHACFQGAKLELVTSWLKFFYRLPSIQGVINGTHFTITKSIGPLSENLYYCAKLEVPSNIVCDIVIDDKKNKTFYCLWDSSKVLMFCWSYKYKVSTFKPNNSLVAKMVSLLVNSRTNIIPCLIGLWPHIEKNNITFKRGRFVVEKTFGIFKKNFSKVIQNTLKCMLQLFLVFGHLFLQIVLHAIWMKWNISVENTL